MKYSITCRNCGARSMVEASGPGDIMCKCPTCGSLIPVHIPSDSPSESSHHHHSHTEPTQSDLNRRLIWFFAGSFIFIVSVIGGLYICAQYAKTMM
ncbi:MAG: hypothetical protein II612_02410 [Prevotella sp.]|nr:hypothetical protein [Prevotella sp.]